MGKTLILLLIIAINISSRENHGIGSHNDTTSNFSTFLSKFDTMALPFRVNDDDVLKYQDSIFNEDGELILNPLFKYLSGEDLVLLKSKFNTEQSNFFSFTKHKMNNFFLLSFIEVDKSGIGWWLKLLTVENSGVPIDTMTLAGEKQGLYETYLSNIDSELNIQSTIFYDIQQYTSARQDLYYATEIHKIYSLQENGQFLLRSSNRQRICFVFNPSRQTYQNIIIQCPD